MGSIPTIPYFQTSRYKVLTMVELAKPNPSDLGVDLGSGDGRIVIAFAKNGVTMHGFETDTDLRNLSLSNIQTEKLSNVEIYNKNFWEENLMKYTIVCCYPMPQIMGRLETKLKQELLPGARVLLHYFPFKHWKLKEVKDNVYLYIR